MADGFKENFTYLVAFVAVAVGLSTFKEAISTWSPLVLFGFEVSWLLVGGVMVAGLVLAVYLAALTFLIGQFNITAFPLKKYAGTAASAVAALALGVPLLIPIMLLLSGVVSLVIVTFNSIDAAVLNNFAAYVSGLTALVTAFLLGRYIDGAKRTRELSYIIRNSYSSPKPVSRETKIDVVRHFLKGYENLATTMVSYLHLRGYGASQNSNLGQLASILYEKGVFSAADVNQAKSLSKMRGKIVHGSLLTKDEIAKLRTSLQQLILKVDEAALDLQPKYYNSR